MPTQYTLVWVARAVHILLHCICATNFNTTSCSHARTHNTQQNIDRKTHKHTFTDFPSIAVMRVPLMWPSADVGAQAPLLPPAPPSASALRRPAAGGGEGEGSWEGCWRVLRRALSRRRDRPSKSSPTRFVRRRQPRTTNDPHTSRAAAPAALPRRRLPRAIDPCALTRVDSLPKREKVWLGSAAQGIQPITAPVTFFVTGRPEGSSDIELPPPPPKRRRHVDHGHHGCATHSCDVGGESPADSL